MTIRDGGAAGWITAGVIAAPWLGRAVARGAYAAASLLDRLGDPREEAVGDDVVELPEAAVQVAQVPVGGRTRLGHRPRPGH